MYMKIMLQEEYVGSNKLYTKNARDVNLQKSECAGMTKQKILHLT